jgi:malate dehydrogenase
MGREKITVIGAGNVGGTAAQRLAEKDCYDVVLLDIIEGLPKGKALDLAQSAPICGYTGEILGTSDYKDTADSSVVVVTSGIPRKPGMSRDELLETNVRIVKSVVAQVVEHSPNAILVIVSNPLDAMTYVAYKISGFPKERVLGMAGILDSARFRAGIAKELGVSVQEVHTMVLGGHGDSMVPLIGSTTIAGAPIRERMSEETLHDLVERTRHGGAEIVRLLEKGSAFYAPSAAAVEMVEAIMKDKRSILPCAALCKGEYGIQDVFVGVPVKLGRRGAEQIVEITLTPDEQAALAKSTADVKELCQQIDGML